MNFEALPTARFSVESDQGIERIVIPAARNWFVLPFLAVWLLIWTVGGLAAVAQALKGDAFTAIWLIFWVLGILLAGCWLGWQINGKETLAVANGALERGWSLLGYGRSKRYDLSQVKHLISSAAPFPYTMMQISTPPFFPMTFGAVKWDYGAATISAASGLSEAEGRMIVEHLKSKMSASTYME